MPGGGWSAAARLRARSDVGFELPDQVARIVFADTGFAGVEARQHPLDHGLREPVAVARTIAELGLVSGLHRSEERRGGKECVSKFSSRGSPDHYKKKKKQ